MNPKKLVVITASAIIAFMFLFMATIFSIVGAGLFYALNDMNVAQAMVYGIFLSGGLACVALIVAVISNSILLTYKYR